MKLETGDRVRVRHAELGGDWSEAVVALASKKGQSVILAFDGAVRAKGGLILGVLPLSIDHEAETVTGLTGDRYEIEVASFQATYSPTD